MAPGREKVNAYRREWRAARDTPEERARLARAAREWQAKRRLTETDEERALRREASLARQRRYLARHNSPEEVEARRAYAREHQRVRRQSLDLREFDRARALRGRYGITVEQYQRLLDAQGGLCALCRGPETKRLHGKVIRLAIDHDHRCCPSRDASCGQCIRGLLCSSCNFAIGKLKDDKALLLAAIDYIDGRAAI